MQSATAFPSPGVLAEMVRHVEESPDVEVCGVVLESGTVVPMRNVAAQPRTAFELDALELLAVLKGRKLALVFHAHVDAGPHWSRADDEGARDGDRPRWPGVQHLVLGTWNGRVTGARLYGWDGTAYAGVDVPLPDR